MGLAMGLSMCWVGHGSINAKCIENEELFEAGPNASNVEALRAFFPDENGSSRAETQGHFFLGCIVGHILVIYLLCNTET
jgi:hypothetical protein